MSDQTKYCLDTNIIIEAWNKYYSPVFCSDYWQILKDLGKHNIIFIPRVVYNEIYSKGDELSDWLIQSGISVHEIDEIVIKNLKNIYEKNPIHQNLVQEAKGRSLADPWVIAHSMKENAIVVTKEDKITDINSLKIKIPNVCENMGIKWINDFQMIKELGIRFNCRCQISETPIPSDKLF
jgi:predicted nucleic acid-binding protein